MARASESCSVNTALDRSFVAVDVETACGGICEIGVATFLDGKIADLWEVLVRPPGWRRGVRVGVFDRELDVRRAPMLEQALPEVRQRLEGRIVVAHTAYDRSTFDAECQRLGVPKLECRWLDSSRVVRRVWLHRRVSGYGLADIASELGIEFDHHRALEDARAAGLVMLSAIERSGVGVADWLEESQRPISKKKKAEGTRLDPGLADRWRPPSQTWLTARTDADLKRWLQAEPSPVPWWDAAKAASNDPTRRLEIATSSFPLPGAFRSAAVALRALIRERKRAEQPHLEELTALYECLVLDSFSMDYSEALQEPGYNVLTSIPGAVVRGLEWTYEEIGFENLRLANKTDGKMLVDAWGVPNQHSTLLARHRPLWDRYESALRERRDAERQGTNEELRQALFARLLVDSDRGGFTIRSDTEKEKDREAGTLSGRTGCLVAAAALPFRWLVAILHDFVGR